LEKENEPSVEHKGMEIDRKRTLLEILRVKVMGCD